MKKWAKDWARYIYWKVFEPVVLNHRRYMATRWPNPNTIERLKNERSESDSCWREYFQSDEYRDWVARRDKK